MWRGMFFRLCDHLAPRLVHQDTPFRRPVSMKWRKSHSDIWFERAECPVRITFQTTCHVFWFWFARIRFHVFFCCSDLIKSIWILSGYAKNPIWAGSPNKPKLLYELWTWEHFANTGQHCSFSKGHSNLSTLVLSSSRLRESLPSEEICIQRDIVN